MYFLLILIISLSAISKSNLVPKTINANDYLLISNKTRTHTHAYYTHTSFIYLFICLVHPLKTIGLFNLFLIFIDMEMGMLCWLYIDWFGIFCCCCGNQIFG